MSEIRTDNDFMIGAQYGRLSPMLPVAISTRQQAYRTAAWIKLMGEVLPDEALVSEYGDVESAIANT